MSSQATDTSIKILVVDDEENILKALKRLLTSEDFDVITAGSGEEALKILEDNPGVALIISDQRMPGLSGADFLEKAGRISPEATKIILTGYADVAAAIDGINKGGAFRYITKPWNDDELLQIVQESVMKFVFLKDSQVLTTFVKKQNDELRTSVQQQTVEIEKKNEELQKLNKDLKKNLQKLISAFSGLIELRDFRAGSHSKNVSELSVKIATLMGLSEKEIQSIAAAALLHDIGEIGMPDILIAKDVEDLTVEEKTIYSQHPVRGQTAIDPVEDLREVGVIIRHHHECYNGEGFPDGISGEKIPLGSRIISIADFFDRTVRRFRSEDAVNLTLIKIKRELGTRFDSSIYPFIEKPAKEVYKNILTDQDVMEMELMPKDLKVGMVLSRDVRSGTGILIINRGVELNSKNIDSLRRSYQIDPSKSGIFVYVKG